MSWQWRMMQNLKRNWLVISKLTWEVWWILTQALESLKNFHFNVLLLSKVYIVWAKKVQRSYLSWHWKVMQNLKKNWHVVWKMTWGIWEIFIRALESVKIGLLWGPFVQSRNYMTLKFIEELCVMTMKNDVELEEESTCHFTIDIRSLTNFYPST